MSALRRRRSKERGADTGPGTEAGGAGAPGPPPPPPPPPPGRLPAEPPTEAPRETPVASTAGGGAGDALPPPEPGGGDDWDVPEPGAGRRRRRRSKGEKPPRPGIEWRRFLPLLAVAGLLVGGYALDQQVGEPEPPGADRGSDEGLLMPVAAPTGALRSTWYCAGGTAGTDSSARHEVIVVNPSDADLTANVTVFPGRVHPLPANAPDLPEPVELPLEVPAEGQASLDLTGQIDAVYAAALVEVDGGDVVVFHQVSGPAGTDTSACSSSAAPVWSFADGTTVQGAQETLAIFNPFPDDAVVDITFATDDGRRAPEDYEGLVVPSGEVVAADVTATVTVREHVSATVAARTGRVVVDRIQSFDGSTGAAGLTVTLGAPEPALAWAWADGLVGGGVSERFTVYNPTDDRAEVSLAIFPTDDAIAIEPFELTIPPRSFGIVDTEQLQGRLGEDPVLHGAVLRSINAVPVVAERRTGGSPESTRPGVDLTLGVPRLSDQLTVGAPVGTLGLDDLLVVFNPNDATLTATVSALRGGSVEELDQVEVDARSRVELSLADLDATDEPVVVQLSLPGVVERDVPGEDDSTSFMAVPQAGTLVPIPDA